MTYQRLVAAFLLLAVGVLVGMFAISMLQVRQQFVDSENEFRTYPSMVTPEGNWAEKEPGRMEERAQKALGIPELVQIRDAYAAFRASQLTTPLDYMLTNSQPLAREIARFQLTSLIRDPNVDAALKVEVATLLGDLYAEDAITYAMSQETEKMQEAYDNAIDAYTLAITSDSTETLNVEAKEHLETLIRLFMSEGSEQPGGGEGEPNPGPRPGASEPGSGY